MVNKRRPRISAAAPMRRLFKYFHKMIKIHCNRCNAILSQQWEFLFINSHVFQFEVSISQDALSFSSLFKMFAFFSFCAKAAVNFAGMTSPTSLFLFPVTVAVRRFSAFACTIKMFWLCGMSLLISAALEYAPHKRHEKLNKRRGAYSSKYGKCTL